MCKAATEYGLSFYSYDVSPDRRTALIMPENPRKGITFSDSCTISFDYRIDTEREKFGYICRIIADGSANVDIMVSSPYNGDPYICAVSGTETSGPLTPGESAFGRWSRMEIRCREEQDSLLIMVNGRKMCSVPDSGKSRHTVAALFGASGFGRFSTSDVAPVSLKDLSFRRDGKRTFSWQLASAGELTRYGNIRLDVLNPLWMLDRNRKWHSETGFFFPSRAFTIPDPERHRLLIVSEGTVTEYDFITGSSEIHSYSFDMKLGQISNDFFVFPDGRLAYIDMGRDVPEIIFFDFRKNEWDRPSSKKGQSRYLHHSTFFNSSDSAVVQLFGYGYHKYSNEINVWKPDSAARKRIYAENVGPRYLSAVGLTDSLAYIFGGKGNDSGMQEFGQRIYTDLYAMDLRDYSVRKLWEKEHGSGEVGVSDMLVSPNGDTLLALTFCPDEYHSSLQLKRISVSDGHMEAVADSIPYDFVDVESEAWLIAPDSVEAFFASVTEKKDSGYSVSIYRIDTPIAEDGQPAATASGQRIRTIIIVSGVLLLLLFCAASGVVGKRKAAHSATIPHDGTTGDEPEEDPAEEQSRASETEERRPGVYLLGGFRVTDRNGKDISDRFSPLMTQLLSAIILYSDGEGGGISNAELKEMFWYDKSNDSYINNRGVNIRKIRNCLEEVGRLDIVNRRGIWSVSDEDGLCDWTVCNAAFDTVIPSKATDEEIAGLVAVARHGSLLPEMRLDWVDNFKARYADKVLSTFNSIIETRSEKPGPEMLVKISDAILCFDPLDENAVRMKCNALISLKRFGRAQKTYSAFIQEYRDVMGEDFGQDFKDFTGRNC